MKDNDEKRMSRQGKSIDFSEKKLGKVKRMSKDDIEKMRNESFSAKNVAHRLKKDKNDENNHSKNTAPRKSMKTVRKNGLTLIEGGKSPKNRFIKLAIAIVCFVLIVSIAVFALTTPTGIVEWMKNATVSGSSGSGFPIAIEDCSAKAFYELDGRLVVQTDVDLRMYDKSGGSIFTRLHGMSTPIVRTSAVRMLTFDRGSNQFRVETASDVLIEGKTESKNSIIDGDIADKGGFVIASLSSDSASLVTVFDKDGNEIYKVHLADNYVVRVAISPNGKKIAVCSVNADNADISTALSIYSVDNDKPIASTTLEDECISNIEFTSNDKCAAISEKRWISFDSNGNLNEFSFGGKSLVSFDVDKSGSYVVCLAGGLISTKNQLVVVSQNGKVNADFEINSTVESLCLNNGRIYVMSSKVCEYDYSGNEKIISEVKTSAERIEAVFNGTAVLYQSAVELY